MKSVVVTKPSRTKSAIDFNQEGANALLAATYAFLRKNNISKESILDSARRYCIRDQGTRSQRARKRLEKAQEDMGTILGTWFSHSKFLDPSGKPLPLSVGKGPHSIARLIQVSGVEVNPSVAAEFMRQSPSFKTNSDGTVTAVRRLFIVPKLEILRAASVIERYFDTVVQITRGRKNNTPMLIERSCYVSEIDLANIAALIRDIGNRSTAFMDSIDGELEVRRIRHSKSNKVAVGELGVHVFVWMKPSTRASKNK